MEDSPGPLAPPAQESGTTSAKTGFLDLPPEIRVVIYNLVIPRDRTFNISMGPPLGPRGRDLLTLQPESGIRQRGLLSGIMCVNKFIYSEATQILYARNDFIFHHIQTLRFFLQRIGPQAQHLRNLCHISDGAASSKEAIREILDTLKSAKHLSSFGITREIADEVGWCRAYNAKQLVKLLHPLLETLHLVRRDEFDEEKRSISNIISIQPNFYYRGHGNKSKSDIGKDTELVEAEMRALIEKRYA